MTSRIEIRVAFGDRDYAVDGTFENPRRLSDPESDRHGLFAEIDRSVAKIKAAIEVGR